jgi:serine/threonine protein kinase/Tfp pilus assembly protein PilF
MDSDRWELVQQILLAALERAEPDRMPFVEERCADDPELLIEVRALLEAHGAAGLIDASDDDPDRPATIGPYKILQTLGEGGMGVVYEAEQTEPVRRRVAIKIIKLGMDTKQIVARFEAERQALAVMDHPNIAKVFDAGVTDDGRSYFVMERVKGVPLTEYCDTHVLTTEARIRLFIPVCRAVQHAHQKGVIHRDLKPSNILVAVHDGEPRPKVIDFGIAKAMGPSLTEKTLVTQAGYLIGTPAYMSPEQAEASGLDVDTRTDIYSLGVMLYELLVGTRPYDLPRVADAAIRRAIRDRDAPVPSSKLTTLPGETRETIAKRRDTDPRTLKRELKGDLDWVIMKAIEKDRTRRYETSSGLALELERYLKDEPVLARPPSALYRFHKFARRHKVALTSAALAILALAAGAVATSIGMVRARRAEDAARIEAQTAQQVSEFMVDLFEVSDPGEARGNEVTAREILDQGAEQIDEELSDQPVVQARLMHVMGEVYQKLGLYPESASLLEGALDTRRELYPGGDSALAASINQLAELRQLQGEYDEAEQLYDEAIAMRRGLFGDQHLDLATSLSNLALLNYQRRDLDTAETMFREVLEMRRALLDEGHEGIAASLNNLGGTLMAQEEFGEAETFLREALDIWREALGDDHPSVTAGMNNLANVLFRQQKHDEAEPIMRQVLATRREVFGDRHPNVATSLNNLAQLLRVKGDYEEAETMMREAVEIQREATSDEHPLFALALRNLGAILKAKEEYEEAEDIYQQSLSIFLAQFGEDHGQVAAARRNLAELYDAWGQPEKAAEYRALLPQD